MALEWGVGKWVEMSRPSDRPSFIDALRGIAALGVVLYHAREGNHIPALTAKFPEIGEALEYGHFGVPIFFVLSARWQGDDAPLGRMVYGAPICPTRSPNIGSLRDWDRSHLREREYTSRSVRLSSIFSICKNDLVIKKSPWSFGRCVLNFSAISFIPFDVPPAEGGVDGCNGGQPVVAFAYRPRAGARSFLPMAWLFAWSMRLLDP
jgi:Acyltransferase family